MELLIFVVIFAISAFAAFVDVIAGGSSLITIPALAAIGIPIITAIGTNRVYVSAFLLVGALNYIRKKVRLDLKLVAGLAAVKMAGAYVGSNFILSVPVAQVKLIAAGLIICALAAIVVLKMKRVERPEPNWRSYVLIAVAVLIIGFYEGAVGGGGGTIMRLLFVLVLGIAMVEGAIY